MPSVSNFFHFSCCLSLNTEMNASFELKYLGLTFEKLSKTTICPTDSFVVIKIIMIKIN